MAMNFKYDPDDEYMYVGKRAYTRTLHRCVQDAVHTVLLSIRHHAASGSMERALKCTEFLARCYNVDLGGKDDT